MKKSIIEIKLVAPGMARIETSINGLLTLDRYVNIARDLLENGFEENNEKLNAIDSIEAGDGMLLCKELEDKSESNIKAVEFAYNNKEYVVNLRNINSVKCKKPVQTEHSTMIRESVDEMFR